MLAIEVRCTAGRCNNSKHTVEVHADDYDAFLKGKFAQDAFPYLSADKRELLLTKTCGDCFALAMGPDPEQAAEGALDRLADAIKDLSPGMITPSQLALLSSGVLHTLAVYNLFPGVDARTAWFNRVNSPF
jgi:hypothetical protein